MTIGFAAPMAIAAIALGNYAGNIINLGPSIIAVSTIIILTILNSSSFKTGANFNFITTSVNIFLILGLCVMGFISGHHPDYSFTAGQADLKQVISPAFAVSLVYVSFAYSGWNSAAYITHQVKNPVKNLPRVFVSGTLIVMTLYRERLI